MGALIDDDLNGVSEGRKYPDGTVIRVFCMRTSVWVGLQAPLRRDEAEPTPHGLLTGM